MLSTCKGDDDGDFPQALRDFVELFNRQRFFESHDVLERAWRANRSRYYKGLIIYASAFVQQQRGNVRGFLKQLGKVPGYLGAYRPYYLGLDVNQILEHVRRWRRDAARDMTDAAVVSPRLTLKAALRRGDEVELTRPLAAPLR